jgi:oligopeptide/dipeptide ABC transporter ATP-binding protein
VKASGKRLTRNRRGGLNNQPLLQVKDLSIGFANDTGVTAITDHINFSVNSGEVFGLAGESGCGKTITALAITRLLPRPTARILSGDILFRGESITAMSAERLRDLRGREISMIFQEPAAALNPLMTVKKQVMELFEYHKVTEEPLPRLLEVIRRVGFADPQRILQSYPYQLSGGMLQRIMIAIAVLLRPALIIADEPTTALDVTVQAQIMELLHEMQRESGTAIILITHNLGLIAQYANRLAIMYAGRIAEYGECVNFFQKPLHPYSQGLIRALPDLHSQNSLLEPIPGQVPQPKDFDEGCRFRERCAHAFDVCRRNPPLFDVDGRMVACFRFGSEA